MIGLGIWQLERARWKEELIVRMSASGAIRAATFDCTIDASPEVRAGRNRRGETGYRYLVPCRAAGGPLLDIGWSKRPDAIRRVAERRSFAGNIAPGEQAARKILVLDQPMPPLEPSALPAPAEIPNNHLLYAVQWFFFALAAATIYVLALRRRNTPRH